MMNKHISTLPHIEREAKENGSSLRTPESDKSATSVVRVADSFKSNMFNET